MSDSLRILLVEDSPAEAILVTQELLALQCSVECHVVADEAALRNELSAHRWDAVIGDWSIANVNGVNALGVLKELALDIPFIAVSGMTGEEVAVAAMRAGARDFVVKDRMWRLVIALKRELCEAGRRASLGLSEARFERLSDSGIIGIAISHLSTDVVSEANDAYLRMLGYSKDELLAGEIRASNLVPPDGIEVDRVSRLEVRATGALVPSERELVKKDGTRIWVLAGAAALDGDLALSFVVDVTARRTAEEALRESEAQRRQAQKMDAIGGVAAGVAHDLNNLLSVILGHGQILSRDLGPGDPVREGLEEIVAAGKSAACLTGQLLAFSRRQVLQPRVADLGGVVGDMEKMLRRLVGEDVEVSVIGAPDLGKALIDPGQLEQVVMNLVVNARDAMPAGGKLTIETKNVLLDETFAAAHEGAQVGPHVLLAVTDTGSGMEAETQRRIFEPFFTTKEVGKGTGLGLSTVLGIVKQSGGTVSVQSELGAGTTIKVYVPRTDRRSDRAEVVTLGAARARGGTETILLVEDDPRVRNVMGAMLRPLGYKVIDAQNGGDALLVCEQHAAPIHLLVTDVIMPRMSGRALADRLAGLRPDMKVMFVSGYPDNAIVRHGVLDTGIAFLQKPLNPDDLGRKVRDVLDAPQGAWGLVRRDPARAMHSD